MKNIHGDTMHLSTRSKDFVSKSFSFLICRVLRKSSKINCKSLRTQPRSWRHSITNEKNMAEEEDLESSKGGNIPSNNSLWKFHLLFTFFPQRLMDIVVNLEFGLQEHQLKKRRLEGTMQLKCKLLSLISSDDRVIQLKK